MTEQENKVEIINMMKSHLQDAEDGSRSLVVISVKNEMLEVSIMNVSILESLNMLRHAYIESVDKIAALIEVSGEAKH